MDDKDTDLGGYVDKLTSANGVSVVTVSDGWVLVFTSSMLKNLLAKADAGGGRVIVQIKNSETIPKN